MVDFDKNSGTTPADAGTSDSAQTAHTADHEASAAQNAAAQNAAKNKATQNATAQSAADAAAHDADASTSAGEDRSSASDAGASHAGSDADSGSLTELGKAKKEAADYLEALQRERADFVNYRHRMIHEKDDYRHMGQEDVLKALLPALDNLDRMREHGKMTKEVEAIAKQIDHGFDHFNITKFGEKGEAFDPARHEAILHRTSPDVDTVQVDTVVEAGYQLGDKVLRAAKVIVVSPQEKQEPQQAQQSQGSQKPEKPEESASHDTTTH